MVTGYTGAARPCNETSLFFLKSPPPSVRPMFFNDLENIVPNWAINPFPVFSDVGGSFSFEHPLTENHRLLFLSSYKTAKKRLK